MTLQTWRIWVRFLMAVGLFHRLAADPQADFDQANRALAQSKYSDAIEQYHRLLRQGTSPALENNLGLAYYQSGQMGQAIAHFRRADRLAPRDAEIQANLRLARGKISKSGGIEGGEGPTLTLNEWAFLPLGAVWLAGGFWGLSRLNPRAASVLHGYAWGAGLLALGLGGFVARAAILRYQEPDLVVVRPDAALRQSPFPEAKSIINLPEGIELHVEDVRSDWFLVRDLNSNRTGWLRQDMVERIPVR